MTTKAKPKAKAATPDNDAELLQLAKELGGKKQLLKYAEMEKQQALAALVEEAKEVMERLKAANPKAAIAVAKSVLPPRKKAAK